MPTSITSSGISFDDATTLTTGVVPTANIANGAVTPVKLSQPYTLATSVASTSGTSIDFINIPSWAKRIAVILNGVSLNGAAHGLIQIGAGSITDSGYVSGSTYLAGGSVSGAINSGGSGVVLFLGGIPNAISGSVVFTLQTSNTWVAAGMYMFDNVTTTTGYTVGKVTLSGTLDRLRVTNTGSDTFDAGTVHISYEG